MIRPRLQVLAYVLGTILAVVLERPLRAAFKAIFDVTVQDYWKDAASPFLQARVGPWGAAVLDWISPFAAGAFTTLLIVVVVEMMFAWWRRKHRRVAAAPVVPEPAPVIKASRALIRLRFSGHSEMPEQITKENIENLFVYWSQQITAATPEGETLFHVPSTWAIFLCFEKPVDYGQLAVNFIDGRPTMWQVRQLAPLTAIVTIDSPMPACEMEIVTRS